MVLVRLGRAALAFLVVLSSALGEDVPSLGDRFALYNACAPVGLVIESLPDDVAATGLTGAQLKVLAESRLRAIGLQESDASSFLHVAASRYAVQLQYWKPVIDVASSDTETIPTFSRSATVRDGTAAGVMLEVSKLLDLFLIEYRRVNESECAGANQPRNDARKGAVPPSFGEAQAGTSPGGHSGRGSDPDDEDESRIYPFGGAVTQPKLIFHVDPEYSERARKAKLGGKVRLAVEIWEDGRPHNIRVLSGIGMGLDEKAIEAVEQWRFEPARKNGQPVKVPARLEITFRYR